MTPTAVTETFSVTQQTNCNNIFFLLFFFILVLLLQRGKNKSAIFKCPFFYVIKRQVKAKIEFRVRKYI